MKINSFDIHEFGFLEKQNNTLSSGLSIFLGRNEAGKSSMLEFFRTVLIGFPASRSKKAKEGVFINKSKQMGGVLEIESLFAGNLKIERKLGALQVFNAEGMPLSSNVYENLLSNVTRDVYCSLYGFSLAELQNLQSLEDEEVQAILHGASSGVGTFSLQYALNQIENTLTAKGSKSLLTNDSFRNFFKTNCQRIDEINAEIKEIVEQNKEIDNDYNELEKKQTYLLELKKEKNTLQEELYTLQTKIQAWQAYTDWHLLLQKLDRIPDIAKKIPHNAKEKINALEQKIVFLANEVRKKEEVRNVLMQKVDNTHINELLIEKYDIITKIFAFKSSYKKALHALPLLEKNIHENEIELAKQVEYLGTNWSVDTIEKLNLSLQVFEKLDEFNISLTKKTADLEQSEKNIQDLNAQIKKHEAEIQIYQENIDDLPKTLLDFSGEEYYELETRNEQALPYYDVLAKKKESSDINFKELENSFHKYGYDFPLEEDLLAKILESQDKILIIQKNILLQEEKIKAEENSAKQIEKEIIKKEERNKVYIEEIEVLNAYKDEQIKEDEENVYKLERLKDEQAKLRENFAENQRELIENQNILRFSTGKIFAFALCFISAFLSLFAFCAQSFYGINSFGIAFIVNNEKILSIMPFLEKLPHSIELSNYLTFFLAFFFMFLLSLFSSINPYIKKAKNTLLNAQNDEEKLKKKLIEIRKNIQALYNYFGIDKLSQDFFENMKLEIEKEYKKAQKSFLLKEKLKESKLEIKNLLEEQEKIKQFIINIQESYERSERQWKEFFLSFSFATIPAPEHFFRDFTRFEQIKLGLEKRRKEKEEIQIMQGAVDNVYALLEKKCSDFLVSGSEFEIISAIKDKAKKIIKQYKEEEKTKEKLSSYKEQVNLYLHKKEQELSKLVQAQEILAASKRAQNAEEQSYEAFLREIDFNEKLAPLAVKTRLNQAKKCLQIKAEIKKMLFEKDQHFEELQKFLQPFTKLLKELSYTDEEIKDFNLLEQVDVLLAKAQEEKERKQLYNKEKEELSIVENNIENEKSEYSNLLQEKTEFFVHLQVDSDEEFEKQVHLANDYAEYKKEVEHIEDKLQFLAKDKELSSFLKEFEDLELAQLQASVLRVEEEIKNIQIDESEQNSALAKLKAHIEIVENSSYLSELKQEKTEIEEKNQKALESYMSYALAQSFIKKTKAEYEKEKQPELIKKASEIFEFITEGKWQNISASLEDNSLTLNPAVGSPLTPDMLSQGTKEQLYLSLRLAYVVLANKYKESLPLLMDDILVNFDLARAEQCAKTLNKIITDDDNQQILFFTCHEYIARMLQENVVNTSLYTVEKGRIQLSR